MEDESRNRKRQFSDSGPRKRVRSGDDVNVPRSRSRPSRFSAAPVDTSQRDGEEIDKEKKFSEMKALIEARLKKVADVKASVAVPMPVVANERDREHVSRLFGVEKPEIAVAEERRLRRSFHWVREGKFVKKGEQLRQREHLRRLLSLKVPSGSLTLDELDLVEPDPPGLSTAVEVPEMEWWDALVVGAGGSESLNYLEQRPAPIRAAAGCRVGKSAPLPMMLTKAERKKLRTQRRREAEKEKHDLQRLGVVKADEARMTSSSFVRVLGSKAFVNPTAAESEMQAQVLSRQEKHEAHNLEQKSTSEEKKRKMMEKLRMDRMKGMAASVYRVSSLANPLHRRKVDLTAQQLSLSGCVLIVPGFALIVVEGGQKALRKFEGLVSRRINWNERGKGEKEDLVDEEEPALNECTKLWHGALEKAHFKTFRFEAMGTCERARSFLRQHNAEVYWAVANPS